ncbi:right-handed parallel beta-helix repeat-containing protein [Sorangium sp. So ce726]|uniref:right-handed parallel beta-helix repeat-containing protein n=1 Tax=Sorangium sp. So ce726 TaxID=3133319 RepID=UPI003F602CFE
MNRRGAPLLLLTATWLLAGCDREAPPPRPAETPDGGGGGGGAAAPGCAPGERTTDSGCEPAGIPPEACGAGFTPGDRACAPVLPNAPCPAGTMAVPGETACREVAPCGEAPWGDIPLDEETQHVDGAYAGSDSDGTPERPWTTVGEGLRAAVPGAVVAIAAGAYPEDVIVDKPVRLWGRCPALVQIAGAGPDTAAAIEVGAGADAAEIRGVAVRSAGQGILVSGSSGVVIDEVWVAGAGAQGIKVDNEQGPAELTVRGSLVEGAHRVGVHSAGAELAIESSVVRGTLESGEVEGTGVGANRGEGNTPASITIRASIVEQSHGVGVYLIASEAIVEDSVIRDSTGIDTNAAGMGVLAIRNSRGQPSQVTLRRSVLEANEEAGIWVQGSSAVVEDTVVRDTRPYPDKLATGWGIYIAADLEEDLRSEATLHRVVVEQSRYVGVAILSSDVSLDGVLVRDTLPRDGDGKHGVGLAVASRGTLRGDVTARGSVVEGSRTAGVFIEGADATLERVAVRRTLPQASDGRFGRGIEVHALGAQDGRSGLVLRSSLVEESVDSGLALFGSVVTLEETTVRSTRSSADGLQGNGVTIVKDLGDSEATLTGVRIEASDGAAVASFGASVALARSTIECNFIDLNVETESGTAGKITDGGQNQCGCQGVSIPCRAKSAGLAPPEPLPEGL